MRNITFEDAEKDLNFVINAVCSDHESAVITHPDGKQVVILSLADFNGINETMYLLGNANNANRLYKSISQLRVKKIKS